MAEIQRVHAGNSGVHRVRKLWLQIAREGTAVARGTVARLMRTRGLAGVVRGRRVRTNSPNPAATRPIDWFKRQFKAECPNRLRVTDFTDVATWSGFAFVASVIDVFARQIVG